MRNVINKGGWRLYPRGNAEMRARWTTLTTIKAHFGEFRACALCVSGPICLPEARDAEGAFLSHPNLLLHDLRALSRDESSGVPGNDANHLSSIC